MEQERLAGKQTIKVLVWGFYFKDNIGDQLFIDAFKTLFPQYQFTFVNQLKLNDIKDNDAIFFGGGSFLAQSFKIEPLALELLKKKPILYIGVGPETDIHPMHEELIKLAKLVAIRSSINVDKFRSLNSNTIIMVDLIFALKAGALNPKVPNTLLVIPNISVVPKWNSPHWAHAAWDSFKTEFAQTLDYYRQNKFTVHFLPFCINDQLNDSYAAAEIINSMTEIKSNSILDLVTDLKSATDVMSKYSVIITQRFHGTILSELVKRPCLTIHHHDKLKNVSGVKLPYYGCSKGAFIQEINLLLNNPGILAINEYSFEEVTNKVNQILQE